MAFAIDLVGTVDVDRKPLDRGRLEHAVVYDPMRQELFTASRGGGAQVDGRRIRVSKQTTLEGALVEIWQVDARGIYLHSRGGDRARRDSNFQGYGRFTTGRDGRYRFRTIRPVAYPGRTPHIHLAVTLPGLPRFSTQCYVQGEPLNQRDGLLNAIREGAVLRVRPKAMTVAVIVAGLLPLFWGAGTGSEVMQRIAAPMVGGMISAPLLSLFVVPVVYRLMRRC